MLLCTRWCRETLFVACTCAGVPGYTSCHHGRPGSVQPAAAAQLGDNLPQASAVAGRDLWRLCPASACKVRQCSHLPVTQDPAGPVGLGHSSSSQQQCAVLHSARHQQHLMQQWRRRPASHTPGCRRQRSGFSGQARGFCGFGTLQHAAVSMGQRCSWQLAYRCRHMSVCGSGGKRMAAE